ncbi:MAG: hypothetical protein ACK56I_22115, partial [bacterium]
SDEDNDNSADEQRDFDFDDLVPILEEEEDEYDLETAFRRFEADAGYQDEGEVATPVQARRQPGPIDSPPVLGFETPPHQRRSRISTPIRRLPPVFSDEEDGASGGERSATLAEQTSFYSALLDKIDTYTSTAEVSQQTLQNLDPEEQQQVQVEIRNRAKRLQAELAWAEKNLDPRAISDTRLDRAFQAR